MKLAIARFLVGLAFVALFILGPLVAGAIIAALAGWDCTRVAC